MVFFTCNACGESLKKAQVDKHVNMCRGCQVLSCIDCGKDFWGEDYKNHMKCISEDQKYGGKGYEAKANKGDVKQQQWIQRVHEALNKPGVNPRLKDVLRQVGAYENVPRKKAKFQNWMRNSLKIANPHLQEQVWEIFATAENTAPKAAQETESEPSDPNGQMDTAAPDDPTEQAPAELKKKLNKRERKEARQLKNGKAAEAVDPPTDGEDEDLSVKRAKKDKKRRSSSQDSDHIESNKKRKLEEEEEEDGRVSGSVDEQPAPKGKFNWKGTIKAVLRAAPDKELPVKRLRKKVLAVYYSHTGDKNFKTEHELLALFKKKLNGNPKFRVLKEKVKLME